MQFARLHNQESAHAIARGTDARNLGWRKNELHPDEERLCTTRKKRMGKCVAKVSRSRVILPASTRLRRCHATPASGVSDLKYAFQ